MRPDPKLSALDRAVAYFSPTWALRRQRSRLAADMLARHYEGAATGRRTRSWNRSGGDANAAATGDAIARMRATARDLYRNNAHARSAVKTIGDHVVGWGIEAKPRPANAAAAAAWREWAGSTACDADGRNDFAGLQKLATRMVAQDGECLVRQRLRRPEDGLPLPLQIQLLEADYLDSTKTNIVLPNGGRIVHGVEFDAIGKRAAYWLFREHPGSSMPGALAESRRVPAEGVLHIYDQERAGQVRGASWFSPVLLKLKDYDDYDDAQLMKQKIAACLSIVTTDVNGDATALGTAVGTGGWIDELGPGAIINAPIGRDVEVVQPPRVEGYRDYATVTLQTIAAGLGLAYEDLTGDFSGVNFSSARMARLRHQDRVHDWRWQLIIPQLCNPVWTWAMEAASIMGRITGDPPGADWTPPPLPFIDPDSEGLAIQRNVRSGIQTLSEALRERGFDPATVLREMAADNKLLDELGLVLDSDPRRMTQAGQAQTAPAEPPPPGPPATGGATA